MRNEQCKNCETHVGRGPSSRTAGRPVEWLAVVRVRSQRAGAGARPALAGRSHRSRSHARVASAALLCGDACACVAQAGRASCCPSSKGSWKAAASGRQRRRAQGRVPTPCELGEQRRASGGALPTAVAEEPVAANAPGGATRGPVQWRVQVRGRPRAAACCPGGHQSHRGGRHRRRRRAGACGRGSRRRGLSVRPGECSSGRKSSCAHPSQPDFSDIHADDLDL